jgi:hypothetical protein
MRVLSRVNSIEKATVTEFRYDGWSIKVTADKQEDGTWTGTYLITEIGKA